MSKMAKLCDCDEKACPAPFSNRLVHAGGQCIHVDGTRHKIRPKRRIKVKKITCWNCGSEVIQYYSDGYGGKRARCPVCNVNFPLE